MSDYHTKNRHKYLIKLHLVFATKYRKRILNSNIANDIKQFCFDVCSKNDVIIDEMETDKDHIHILVDIPPTLAPSKLVKSLKQETTWNIWKTHQSYLKKCYWKENTFWSDGYFVCSTGDASTETIRKYIENQG